MGGHRMMAQDSHQKWQSAVNPVETRKKRKPVTPESDPREAGLSFANGGGNDALPQNSLKASAPRNSLIINAEVISHNHFPTTRPEKQFFPLISRHRTRVTGLQ
jgi:hypothetical protein